jgi:hypothetical protein
VTSAGDGEVLSRRELRARHPELFRTSDSDVIESDAAVEVLESVDPIETPDAANVPEPVLVAAPDASELPEPRPEPVLVAASAAPTSALAGQPLSPATMPAPASAPVVSPAAPPVPPVPPAASPPAFDASTPAPRAFTLDLPPAPDWTTVSSPVVPPTIDVSAWRPTGPQQANTGAVWWIVILPLLGGVALTGLMLANPVAMQIVLGIGTGTVTLESLLSTGLWLVGASVGTGFVVFLLSLLIGFRDRAKLRELGHQRTASPWWMVLATLVYLIIRTVHAKSETGRGSAPLVVWVLLYIVPSVILTIVQIGALFV